MAAVALWEERTLIDDRRARISVLVYSPAFVDVADAPALVARPGGHGRTRLVLHAGGDLRWWDSTASGGPVDVHELPLSDELAEAFASLRSAYADHAQQTATGGSRGFDRVEESWTREALETEARDLWYARGRSSGAATSSASSRPDWTRRSGPRPSTEATRTTSRSDLRVRNAPLPRDLLLEREEPAHDRPSPTLQQYLPEPLAVGEPDVGGPLAVFPLFGARADARVRRVRAGRSRAA